MPRAAATISFFVLSCVLLAACPAPEAAPGLGTSATDPLVVSLAPGGSELHLGAGVASGDPIRVRLDGDAANPAYRTNWTLGAGTCLRVVPRVGDPLIVTGAPLAADYYHLGRVLGVSIGAAPNQQFMGFGDPISWQTVPCPTAP